MDADKKFVTEKLMNKSNIIVGFVILQSITLAYNLSKHEFKASLNQISYLELGILLVHILILAGALIAVISIGKRIVSCMQPETVRLLKPLTESHIKCALILIYGIIPIVIMLVHLFGNSSH